MPSYFVIHIRTEEIDTFVAEGGGRFGRNNYSVPADYVKFETWGVRIDDVGRGGGRP